jgi:hypothetical protein
MKIIFSHFFDVRPLVNINEQLVLQMAQFSNYLIQKHGLKTIFCGNKASIEKFKSIPYNEFIQLEEYTIENLKPYFWNISKLLVMSQIKEPFIHVDSDLFLFKNFDEDFLNKNIVYFHDENHNDNLTNNFQERFKIQPLNGKNFKNSSRNCALIGGQNYKLINKISSEILEFLLSNESYIKAIFENGEINNYPKFMPSVLIEQVWIFKLLDFYKNEYTPYLKSKTIEDLNLEGYIRNISHIQSEKNNPIVQKTLYELNRYINF